MKAEHKQSEQFSDNPKSTLYSCLYHTFLILTALAFVFRVIGLDLFASHAEIVEPSEEIQKLIKVALKVFELMFIYKILTHKGFILCFMIAVIQTIVTPFLGAGFMQSAADLLFWIVVPLLFRKDKLRAIGDSLALYLFLTLYSALSLIGKFGELETSQVYSFYKAIMSVADYKLFIVTLYFYISYKGGIRIWKTKRKLFQQ